jgi:anaerobic ribonucleoside-triphosphate reductase activating protein
MKILRIDTDCTDNGIGLRTTVYISGCTHLCKGCHNPSSWNTRNGVEMSINEVVDVIEDNAIADVTLSGGDGLTYQYEETLKLLNAIKNRTNKNIWLYTGYTFEEVLTEKSECLNYIDVLVDGRFEIANRDLGLLFRGSSNQRLVDVKESLANDKVVEICP